MSPTVAKGPNRDVWAFVQVTVDIPHPEGEETFRYCVRAHMISAVANLTAN